MDKSYKTAMDKVKLNDDFKKSLKQLMEDSEITANAARNKQSKTKTRIIGTIAASFTAAVCVSLVLIFTHSDGGHSFILKVDAGEALSENGFKPIGEAKVNGMDISELYETDWSEGSNIINELIFGLDIEGKNIDSVTFSCINGCFEVENERIAAIESYEGKADSFYSRENEGFSYCDSITLNYEEAAPHNGRHLSVDDLTLCTTHPYNPSADSKLIEKFTELSINKGINRYLYPPEDEDYFKKTLEDFFNSMYSDTEIKVTAHFTDGSDTTQTLALSAACEINGMTDCVGGTEEKPLTWQQYNYTVRMNAKLIP